MRPSTLDIAAAVAKNVTRVFGIELVAKLNGHTEMMLPCGGDRPDVALMRQATPGIVKACKVN